MDVAVIGGGAAGFFAAISAKSHYPEARVVLFEKSSKTLSKVKVSGGGRCNVTHYCLEINELIKNYPRGSRFLKKSFYQFMVQDTIDWFQSNGVDLKTEKDNRMFPVSNNSQTIIDCLESSFHNSGCVLKLQSAVTELIVQENSIMLKVNDQQMIFDKVIVASGGSPKRTGLDWLARLGHQIEHPVPSLFTFNMKNHPICSYMGAVAPNCKVRIQGEKLESNGPVLITHWGMSGPAVLKLSSFGARVLAEKEYNFSILVNWFGNYTEDEIRHLLRQYIDENRLGQLSNFKHPDIPKRIWGYILGRVGLEPTMRWVDVSKKDLNRLVNSLMNDVYQVKGKTTFKEEFVTCGGVSLSDINPNTLQSKKVPNLYFAGEVLDIDGVTGGFNFQAAWTTGFIAGKLN